MSRGRSKRGGYQVRILSIPGTLAVLSVAACAGPLDKFNTLEGQLLEEQARYVEAMEAVDKDDHGHPQPGAKLPRDARPPILAKIDALADRSLGHKDGVRIALGAFVWSWNLDLDLDHLRDRFDRLVTNYADSEEIEDVLEAMPAVAANVGKSGAWATSLQRLIDKTKRSRTKLAATFALGQVHHAGQATPEAKAAFAQVLNEKDNEDFAALARGFIYEIDHLQVGMTAPDFTVKTLDGKTISLKSLRGKVVLLDFWATWCPICITEMPRVHEAQERWKDKPFEVLAISLDYTRTDLEAMLKDRDIPGIHTWDEAGVDNPAGVLYNVQNLPTWYLLDEKGVIRARDPFGDKLNKAIADIFTPETTKLGAVLPGSVPSP